MASGNFGIGRYDNPEDFVFSLDTGKDGITFKPTKGSGSSLSLESLSLGGTPSAKVSKEDFGASKKNNVLETFDNITKFIQGVRKDPKAQITTKDIEKLKDFDEMLSGTYTVSHAFQPSVRTAHGNTQQAILELGYLTAFRDILNASENSSDAQTLKALYEQFSPLAYGRDKVNLEEDSIFQAAKKKFFDLLTQQCEQVVKMESDPNLLGPGYLDQRLSLNSYLSTLSTAEKLSFENRYRLNDVIYGLLRETNGQPPKDVEKVLVLREKVQKVGSQDAPVREKLMHLGALMKEFPKIADQDKAFQKALFDNMLRAYRDANPNEQVSHGNITKDEATKILREQPIGKWIRTNDGVYAKTGRGVFKDYGTNKQEDYISPLTEIQQFHPSRLERLREQVQKICSEKVPAKDKLEHLGTLIKEFRSVVDKDTVFQKALCDNMRQAYKEANPNAPDKDNPPLQKVLEFHPLSSGKISTNAAEEVINEQEKVQKGSWLLRCASFGEWMPLSQPIKEDEGYNQDGTFPNNMSLEEALTMERYPLSKCIQVK